MYAGGLVGGILASFINSWLVDRLHVPFDIARDHLIIPMAAVLLLLLLPVGRTNSAAPVTVTPQWDPPESTPTDGLAEQGGTIQHALRTLTGDRHARLVSMAFVFAAASAICLDSLFFWILSEQSTGGGGFVHLLAMLAS